MKLPVSQEVVAVQKQVGKAVGKASAIRVDSNEKFQIAGELLKQVIASKKAIKAAKEKFTKPAKDIIAQAKELFDQYENDVKQAEKILKDSMKVYSDRIERENREKGERLDKRVEKGTMRLDTAIRKAGELDSPDLAAAGTSKSMIKKVRIVNPDLVPKEYWGIDEAAVRRDALGNKTQGIEPIEIPGVEVYEESSLSVR